MPRVGSEQYAVVAEPASLTSASTSDIKTIDGGSVRATGIWLTVEGVAARMTFGGANPGAGTGPGLVIPVGTAPLFYPFPVEKTLQSGAKIKFASNTAGSSIVSYILVQ